jgi:hypothetical protein
MTNEKSQNLLPKIGIFLASAVVGGAIFPVPETGILNNIIRYISPFLTLAGLKLSSSVAGKFAYSEDASPGEKFIKHRGGEFREAFSLSLTLAAGYALGVGLNHYVPMIMNLYQN